MKTFLVLLAATTALAGSCLAQVPASATPAAPAPVAPPTAPDQQAARRAQYLTKELGLTADQQARLAPILLAQRQEMLGLRSQAQTGGQRRGMGQDLKAAQARYDAQVKAILTPDQYARFGQLKEAQRDKLRERRANGQGPQTPE